MEPSEAECLAMDLMGAASEARAHERASKAYRERNLAVAALLRTLTEADAAPVGREAPAPEQLEAEDDPADWCKVWAALESGQVSWHLPADLVPECIPERRMPWDGHDTALKNRRVAEYALEDDDDPTTAVAEP